MKQTFADTSYWVAYLKENDQWTTAAEKALGKIGSSEIVTTESVLIEVLNYFSEYRPEIKKFVVASIEALLADENVLVLQHRHEDFLKALQFYKSRLDKGYSLTDCISMNAMREFGIAEILTNDTHFQREGFTKLF
ncbi:MAG: PIN domain-containing protein [Pyrinomonadaceae bacterium]|nr:PIN domain-containing protein [Pyrinomonadaceae bacterium]